MSSEYYLNIPQARALLVDAPIMMLIYGRRLGKSSEIISHLSIKRIFEMPRAVFLLMGRTYAQLLERTLPATKSGWAKRGYVEGVHYVVGKKPPVIWPKPFFIPSSYEHVISWFNGSCFYLGSQDRAGLVNSLTVFGLYGDEAKFLIEDRFKEDALPTVSAPASYFPGNPYNRFVVLCTSMPDLPNGQWIFDYEKLMDVKICKVVLQAALECESLKGRCKEAVTDASRLYLEREISSMEEELRKVRRGLVYYDEASTLANLSILGMEYMYQQRDTLKDSFRQEILNVRPSIGEKSFYANLRPRHFYADFNYSYIDTLHHRLDNTTKNCRMDQDLVSGLPLIVGVDFGAQINCLVTAQRLDSLNKFQVIKNMYVLRPSILDDLFNLWADYYQSHLTKEVLLWYDSSGNVSQANSKLTYAQQAAAILRRRGWQVQLKTMGGNNPLHHKKYLLINAALSGHRSEFPSLLFNEPNCSELKESMVNAPSRKDSSGMISKVKSSERSSRVPPQYATHLSDAFDYMFYGEFNPLISSFSSGCYDVFVR